MQYVLKSFRSSLRRQVYLTNQFHQANWFSKFYTKLSHIKRYTDNMNVDFILQHQQQVAAAVERAKQVTMTELNQIIGVGEA